MPKNVIPLPITNEQRKLNEHGDGYVPCLTSQKWLQFPETAHHESTIPVKLMTQIEGQEPIQVSELLINKADLLRAANSVDIEYKD